MDKIELERLYLVEHKTMQEIGDLLGCTRQNVHHRIRKFGIDKTSAERFNVRCDLCGREFSTTRKRYKLTIKHFCSLDCYKGYMKNPEYKQWRNGQRIARAVMERHLGRELASGEIVHHNDGDNNNNTIENLRLFPSTGEHTAYHHKVRRDRLEGFPEKQVTI